MITLTLQKTCECGSPAEPTRAKFTKHIGESDRDDVDLTAEDFTQRDSWQPVDETDVTSLDAGHEWAVHTEAGSFVVRLVDGKLDVFDATIQAISVAVSLAVGPRAGNIYRDVGESRTAAGTTADPLLDLRTQDYSNPDLWQITNLDAREMSVHSFVQDSDVTTDGELSINSVSGSTIDALVGAATKSVSAGLFGDDGSMAVSIARNRIANDIKAYVENAKVETVGGKLEVKAIEDADLFPIRSPPPLR